MSDEIDWTAATWEGNRGWQHADFLALSFREKMIAVEEMGRVAERLRAVAPEPPRGQYGADSPDPPADPEFDAAFAALTGSSPVGCRGRQTRRLDSQFDMEHYGL